MSLQGLPDFYQPIQTEGWQIFYPYENAGECLVLPDSLQIGEHANGNPDLTLTLVRGQNPLLLPKPHGLLDFRLQSHYPLNEALNLLRETNSNATVQPIAFQSGFLRLYPQIQTDEIPEDLKLPMPLAWNGLTSARYSLTISESTAIALKGALTGNILKLLARAEIEMIGVAPRLPLQVRFDPAVLLNQLAALGNAQRQIACEDILSFFRRDLQLLPLEVIGEVPPDGFAETMTDWIRAHFGTFIPSPNDDSKPHIALSSGNSGSIEWNLSQALQAYRTIVLTLDPLSAAHQLVQTQGLDAVFQETTVPPIPTGTWSISVAANLPDRRPGVLSMGVTLKAPPVLPYRPQARIASAELTPPDDSATLMLRLSPIEKLEYMVSTSVVLQDTNGIRQLKSEEFSHVGDRLYIRPDQFPVNFMAIEATRSLLELATLQGTCHWQEGETLNSQPFELNRENAATALVLPKQATNTTLEISARSLEGTQTLQIPLFPAKNCQLGLHSFREYGAHQITVECDFSDDVRIWAIDLLPEDAPETEMSVLFFTPVQPHKTWSWLAKSPFRAGYRYRCHRDLGASPAEWSAVQSPFVPLNIQAQKLVTNV